MIKLIDDLQNLQKTIQTLKDSFESPFKNLQNLQKTFPLNNYQLNETLIPKIPNSKPDIIVNVNIHEEAVKVSYRYEYISNGHSGKIFDNPLQGPLNYN